MPCDLQAFAVVSALAWSLPTSSVKATIIAFRRGVPVRTGRAFSAATRIAVNVISTPESSMSIVRIASTTAVGSRVGSSFTALTVCP